MKENKKNKNASKKLVTLASVGLSSAVAFAVAAPLIINAQNSSSSDNVSKQKGNFALVEAPNTQKTEIGIEQQKPNIAPKYLYSLPVLDPLIDFTKAQALGNITGFLNKLQDALELWKLSDNKTITDKYSSAVMSIAAYSALASGNSSGGLAQSLLDLFNKGKSTLTDVNEITNNYNLVNNIGTTVTDLTKPLEITLPKEVRNVATTLKDMTSNTIHADTAQDDYLMNTAGFEYKIAEIKLDKLKDQRSLVFSYSDESTADYANHDYKIVISNENREIDRFLSGSTPDIKTLIANQTIFIRDKKGEAKAPENDANGGREFKNDAPNFNSDKFRFAYDATSKTLSLLAKPDANNVAPAAPAANATQKYALKIGIDSAASDKEAIKPTTTKWGFLDNSLAPKHLSKLSNLAQTGTDIINWLKSPIDPKEKMVDDSKPEITVLNSTQLSVFSAIGKWHQQDEYKYKTGQTFIKPANWIRMYLGKNMKIAKSMQFNGKPGSDNFEEGSSTEFSIQFIDPKGPIPTEIKPSSGFVIRSDAAATANIDLKGQRFAVVTEDIDNNANLIAADQIPENRFLRADIVLNRGIMSFDATNNGDENPFELSNVAQKIFFENPWSAITSTAEKVKEISTNPQMKVTDQDAELLGDVITNWTDKSNIQAGAKNSIMSYKELIELFKKVPVNKTNFDNLDRKIAAQEAAEKVLATANASGDATAIQDAESKLSSAQTDVANATDVILGLFPKWPFGQNASLDNIVDSQMVFDSSVSPNNSTDLESFIYAYRHFYIDKATNNLMEDAGSQKTHGLFKTDKDFAFELDANGDKIPVETDGEAVYNHFRAYTNEMIRWQKDKLGIDASMGLGDLEPYDPPKGGVMGWVKNRLINTAGSVGEELKNAASLLSKMWAGGSYKPTTDEEALKDEIKKFMPQDWEAAITGKNDESNGKVDTSTAEYKISRQYIYMILQAYYVKVLNKILEIETDRLDTNRKLVLRETFRSFFSDTAGMKKINDTTITKVDTKSTSDLANVELVGVGDYGVIPAKNGLESLKSLLSFIYDAGLQQRFLNNNDSQATFNAFAKDGAAALDDPQLFVDEKKKGDFVKIMQFTGTIIDKTFDKNQDFVPLNTILDKINSSAYDKSKDGATALSDLSNTIKYAVETISTSTSGYNTLKVLGAEAKYTYLQSLAMGKNLNSIFNEYIDRKKAENIAAGKPENDSLKQVIEFIHESKEFDEKAVASLAISLGYFNLEYFIENLSNPTKVTSMARELLNKDLSQEIQLKVDDSNQLVNIISQPGALAKYAFLGIGVSSALIGGSIFGLSFRKSVRTSRKNIIMERAIFIGIAVLGIALALFGIIPGIL